MDPAKTTERREGYISNPKLRLREQLQEVMRFKQFSLRMEEAYWVWIRQFILFHGKRHPRAQAPPLHPGWPKAQFHTQLELCCHHHRRLKHHDGSIARHLFGPLTTSVYGGS